MSVTKDRLGRTDGSVPLLKRILTRVFSMVDLVRIFPMAKSQECSDFYLFVSTNGRQSVEQSFHSIKKISRIWGNQTHRKIAMNPDLEFRARKKSDVDSTAQGGILAYRVCKYKREAVCRAEYSLN